ncbi:MAG: permease prefix domain 1-containing protein [Anaerolineae bacterium]|jgi:hypothetical protein
MTIDDVVDRICQGLDLEAETEHEVREEIRCHLQEAVQAARAQELDDQEALADAAARFGGPEVAEALQATHAGWGPLEGIAAAALPVLFTLLLRWLIFAPDGTAVGWREVLSRPALWAVATIALLFPLSRFPRRRYALVGWAIFWGLSLIFVIGEAVYW